MASNETDNSDENNEQSTLFLSQLEVAFTSVRTSLVLTQFVPDVFTTSIWAAVTGSAFATNTILSCKCIQAQLNAMLLLTFHAGLSRRR